MSIAREGWPFVVPFVIVGALLGWLGMPWAMLGTLGVGLLVLLFFRDPKRRFDGDPELILAAADGRIIGIETLEDPAVAPGSLLRIATFLSVFDVHVQRAPASGEVLLSAGKRGRKLAAFDARAAALNESHLTVLRQRDGSLIGVRQIAGLVARRVVHYLERGDRVQRGEHLGIIKFGSRVDVLLPSGYQPLVEPGQSVRAGLTPVARPGPAAEAGR